MQIDRIQSVGIDIGTTTTQLVFSSLKIANSAGPTQVPRFSIVDREIIYKSPVIFTPHKNAGSLRILDERALADQIKRWYSEAGLLPADVPTGAAIITGESLKADNARQTVMHITEQLGDFVVATAGPRLESIIAGKGSGAAALSAKERKTVLNIDIGGGTSNYAVFRNGELLETACINIGGRLIETDATGNISRVHSPAKVLVDAVFGAAHTLQSEDITLVMSTMAEILYNLAFGRVGELANKLMQTPPLSQNYYYDAVIISGGVGFCLNQHIENVFCFGDTGPLLAKAILQHDGFAAMNIVEGISTVRATVIGAGAWALSLSGATVWADNDILPLKNIPIVPVRFGHEEALRLSPAFLYSMLSQRDIDPDKMLFAFGFKEVSPNYATVSFLADQISSFWKEKVNHRQPLVVIFNEDIGKIMGMELKARLTDIPIIVLDEIQFQDGDYIDIGELQKRAGFLPVIIKSLAFPVDYTVKE